MADEEQASSPSSAEEIVEAEPLATTRSRRANAGNRMGNLIQEEDDFYNNLYGGFNDEEDDGDFDSDDEGDDDEVDSDFSIDETDEIAPEHQMVEEEQRKRKNIYRDPKPKIPRVVHSTPQEPSKASSSNFATPQSPGKHRPERSFRDSTKKKAAETIRNIETGKKKRKLRRIEPHRKLTQEELLEEAKKTEEENIRSLEIYQRLESEKLKKIKMIKRSIPAPYVTYYSSVFTNPLNKERYSRNLCTYVGCEPQSMSAKSNTVTGRNTRSRS